MAFERWTIASKFPLQYNFKIRISKFLVQWNPAALWLFQWKLRSKELNACGKEIGNVELCLKGATVVYNLQTLALKLGRLNCSLWFYSNYRKEYQNKLFSCKNKASYHKQRQLNRCFFVVVLHLKFNFYLHNKYVFYQICLFGYQITFKSESIAEKKLVSIAVVCVIENFYLGEICQNNQAEIKIQLTVHLYSDN